MHWILCIFTRWNRFLHCCEYCTRFWKVAALLSLLVHTQLELTLSFYHLTVWLQHSMWKSFCKHVNFESYNSSLYAISSIKMTCVPFKYILKCIKSIYITRRMLKRSSMVFYVHADYKIEFPWRELISYNHVQILLFLRPLPPFPPIRRPCQKQWITPWMVQVLMRSLWGRRLAASLSIAWRSSWSLWPARAQTPCKSSASKVEMQPPQPLLWSTSKKPTASTRTARKWQGRYWSWHVR